MKFFKIIWGSSFGLGKDRGNKKAFYIIYPKLTIYLRLQFLFSRIKCWVHSSFSERFSLSEIS